MWVSQEPCPIHRGAMTVRKLGGDMTQAMIKWENNRVATARVVET